MSKEAQRKRSAYQEGFKYGRQLLRATVNPRWRYAADFRAGWYAGRKAAERAQSLSESTTFTLEQLKAAREIMRRNEVPTTGYIPRIVLAEDV